nr:MFS transporter [Streptomyces marianii]
MPSLLQGLAACAGCGYGYVRRTAGLWVPLAIMALIGTLACNFQVLLPLLVRTVMHGGARTYGFLSSAMGLGSMVGGFVVASLGQVGVVPLIGAAVGFAATVAAAAAVSTVPAEAVVLTLVGVASTVFLAIGYTTLQLVSDPAFRGRVAALWSVAFLGSAPVGGPIIGVVSHHLGPRVGLALGAGACLAAAVLGLAALPGIPQAARSIRHGAGVIPWSDGKA